MVILSDMPLIIKKKIIIIYFRREGITYILSIVLKKLLYFNLTFMQFIHQGASHKVILKTAHHTRITGKGLYQIHANTTEQKVSSAPEFYKFIGKHASLNQTWQENKNTAHDYVNAVSCLHIYITCSL